MPGRSVLPQNNSVDLPLWQWSKQGHIQNKQKFPKQQEEFRNQLYVTFYLSLIILVPKKLQRTMFETCRQFLPDGVPNLPEMCQVSFMVIRTWSHEWIVSNNKIRTYQTTIFKRTMIKKSNFLYMQEC